MSLAWSDLGDTAAHAIGNVVFSSPFAGVNAQYVLTQQFMQPIANFSPLALNTAHGTYSSYKLVEERNFKDMGGGIQTWERVYAQTPSQRVELSTMNYNFIGYWGTFPVNNSPQDPSQAIGRPRKVHFVLVKHQFDYYLVDGTIIVTQYDVPVVSETKYLGPSGSGVVTTVEVDLLWDTVMAGSTFANASNPSLTTYKGYITADAGTSSSFSIVAQGSSVRRWMGNIWERETLYIKAI